MKIQHTIEHEGQMYKSLKEFSDSMGLPYTSVTACHRRGMTPDQIIEYCQFTTAAKANVGGNGKAVTYKGITYKSLYEAAETLGVNPGRIYYLCNSKGMIPEDALDYAIRKLSKPGKGYSPNSKPCVVEGVSYPSREAALAAYGQQRVTVYQRMQRNEISFEEAVVQGKDMRTYRAPTTSLFPGLDLVPMDEALIQPVMADLKKSLESYNYAVRVMKDAHTGLQSLLVNGNSYIYYNQQARGLEMISALPIDVDTNTLMELNAAYVAAKVFRDQDTVYVSSFHSAREKNRDVKSLMNAWFSFVSIRDMFARKYGKGPNTQY